MWFDFFMLKKKYSIVIWFVKDFKLRYIGCEDLVVYYFLKYLYN